MNNKFIFFPIILLTLIFINSCDDNVIVFDSSNDSGLNYFNQSFFLNFEKSLFNSTPEHHLNDSVFNQSLAPRLYLGDIGLFGEENLSYALFQIDYDIINNYSICDTSLVSLNDIVFTL